MGDGVAAQPAVDPVLSVRFEKALVWTNELFRNEPRKGSSIPYVSHLLSVSALVLEDGGSEDEAIAALLHDVLEDIGMELEDPIRERFGARVAQIVLDCTDADRRLNEDSWTRKQRAIAHIPAVSSEAIRVLLADKLHNARALLRDLEVSGDAVWQRFRVGRDRQLEYYGKLLAGFRDRRQDWVVDEFARTVDRITELANRSTLPG